MNFGWRFLAVGFLVLSGLRAADHDQLCGELVRAERHFCEQVGEIGISDAFVANMADECFLPNRLGLSKAEFEHAVQAARAKAGLKPHPGPNPQYQLIWTPAKVDVSADGTLGYTWGKYESTAPGEDGKKAVSAGIYLTIWKRQADGSWKFVYDGSPEVPKDPAALQNFFARSDFPSPPIYAP